MFIGVEMPAEGDGMTSGQYEMIGAGFQVSTDLQFGEYIESVACLQ